MTKSNDKQCRNKCETKQDQNKGCSDQFWLRIDDTFGLTTNKEQQMKNDKQQKTKTVSRLRL